MDRRPSPTRTLPFTTCCAALLAAACGGSPGGGPAGAPLFAKTIGGPGFDALAGAVETPDGGYLVVGSYGGRATLDREAVPGRPVEDDLFVVKLDDLGNEQWSRSYAHGAPTSFAEPSSVATPRAAFPAADDGFFVIGSLRDQLSGDPDDWTQDVSITRLTSAGTTSWETALDIPAPQGWAYPGAPLSGEDWPVDAAVAPDGGLFVAGYTVGNFIFEGSAVVNAFPWLMRVDASGNPLWSRTLQTDLTRTIYLQADEIHVVASRDGAVYAAFPARSGGPAAAARHWTRALRFGGDGTPSWEVDVDDVHVTTVGPALAGTLAMDDGLLFAGTGIGFGGVPVGTRGVVLEPDGDVRFDVGLSLARVDRVVGRRVIPATGASYHFVGEAADGTPGLTVDPRDVNGAPMVNTGGTFPGAWRTFDLRLDTGATPARIEALALDRQPGNIDPYQAARTLSGATDSPVGAPFDTSAVQGFLLPARDDLSLAHQVAGFVPGTDRTWSWMDVAGMGLGAFRLEVREANGTSAWTRNFSADASDRAEEAVGVVLLDGPGGPDDWRAAILSRADVDVDGAPGKESNVPWLLVIDSQAGVLTDVALDLGELPEGVPSGLLAASSDGDLFVGLRAGGAPRVARVDAGGNVQWCSAPVTSAPDAVRQFGLAPTGDGGVTAACNDAVARFDGNGTPLWRARLVGREVLALAPAADDGTAVLSADGGSPSRTLFLDLLDASGGRVRGTSWATGQDLDVTFGGALEAGPDGGFVALTTRRLAQGVTPSLIRDADMIALHGFGPAGAPAWTATYGGLATDRAVGLARASDGGLIVSGFTDSVTTSRDGWVLRLDSCGRVGTACDAEFRHLTSGFEAQVTAFTGGERFDDLLLAAAFDQPGAVLRAGTASLETSLTGIEVTRQCSALSKDTPPAQAGGGGSYGGLLDLTVIVEGPGSGRVTVDPPGLVCLDLCELDDIATAGTVIQFEAIPDPGSSFGGFTGVDDADGVFATITFGQADRTVRVRFE